MNTPYLQVSELTCYRGDQLVWQDVNFQINSGELLQVVGANGSGKTSLLRILAGLLTPNRGEIFWCGDLIKPMHHSAYLRDLCYRGHQLAIKNELTVLENLKFNFRYQRREQEIIKAIEIIGLPHKQNILCRQLSQGQRQRVALIDLLLSSAKIWILDEPFISLDAKISSMIQQIIISHLAQGGIIIMATHHPLEKTDLTIKTLYLG